MGHLIPSFCNSRLSSIQMHYEAKRHFREQDLCRISWEPFAYHEGVLWSTEGEGEAEIVRAEKEECGKELRNCRDKERCDCTGVKSNNQNSRSATVSLFPPTATGEA